VPAAWLIEQCGWKGKTLGGAQVWPKQPLVIVNANNATSEDIIALAAAVRQNVRDKFGIDLHPEVNYI
jgi:UDP-N-acetylmuramate dehydrogenase